MHLGTTVDSCPARLRLLNAALLPNIDMTKPVTEHFKRAQHRSGAVLYSELSENRVRVLMSCVRRRLVC